MQNKLAQMLNNEIEYMCKEACVPGLAFAIYKDGQMLFDKYYGYSDRERLLSVTEDTVFGVASITKSFTALSIMILADQGKVSVNDSVVRWLPEIKNVIKDYPEEMSIHHLLTHTSGLPGMEAINQAKAESIRQDPDGSYLTDRVAKLTNDYPVNNVKEMINAMADTGISLLGEPGEVFNYSNEGFGLLQEIIERASNQTYQSYVHENVLKPLGMKRTTFLLEDLEEWENVTELYAYKKSLEKDVFHSPTWWHSGGIYAHGALKTSITDLMKYLEIYRLDGKVNGKRIVSKKGIREMTTCHVKMPHGDGYGYGLHVDDIANIKVVGHGGSIKGVSSHMKIAQSKGITIAVLTNINKVGVKKLVDNVLSFVTGESSPESYKNNSLEEYANHNFKDFAGLYESCEGTKISFVLGDGELYMYENGQSILLTPASESLFITPSNNKVKFIKKNNKTVAVFKGVRLIPKIS